MVKKSKIVKHSHIEEEVKLKKKFFVLQDKIIRLKQLRQELNSLDVKGFEKEASVIRSKLKDIEAISEIEKDLKILRQKILKSKKKPSPLRKIARHVEKLKKKDEQIESKVDVLKKSISGIKTVLEKKQKQKVDSGVGYVVDKDFDVFLKKVKSELSENVKKKQKEVENEAQSEIEMRKKILEGRYRTKVAEMEKSYRNKIQRGLDKEIHEKFNKELHKRFEQEKEELKRKYLNQLKSHFENALKHEEVSIRKKYEDELKNEKDMIKKQKIRNSWELWRMRNYLKKKLYQESKESFKNKINKFKENLNREFNDKLDEKLNEQLRIKIHELKENYEKEKRKFERERDSFYKNKKKIEASLRKKIEVELANKVNEKLSDEEVSLRKKLQEEFEEVNEEREKTHQEILSKKLEEQRLIFDREHDRLKQEERALRRKLRKEDELKLKKELIEYRKNLENEYYRKIRSAEAQLSVRESQMSHDEVLRLSAMKKELREKMNNILNDKIMQKEREIRKKLLDESKGKILNALTKQRSLLEVKKKRDDYELEQHKKDLEGKYREFKKQLSRDNRLELDKHLLSQKEILHREFESRKVKLAEEIEKEKNFVIAKEKQKMINRLTDDYHRQLHNELDFKINELKKKLEEQTRKKVENKYKEMLKEKLRRKEFELENQNKKVLDKKEQELKTEMKRKAVQLFNG